VELYKFQLLFIVSVYFLSSARARILEKMGRFACINNEKYSIYLHNIQ
jgi:hypothetical protein